MKRPTITPAQRLRCFTSHGAMILCQATGCDSIIYIREAEVDHYVALIDGGKHEDANLRPICSSCHRKKSIREHKANAKAKRLATANQVHRAVTGRVMKREPSRLKGRGFGPNTKKFNGAVSPSKRKPTHASTD